MRGVQWNPRRKREIAVATGYGRQIRIYDLSRWQEGAAPTRTLNAAMGPSSRAPHPHRGVVSVKHLESMGRYVVAGARPMGAPPVGHPLQVPVQRGGAARPDSTRGRPFWLQGDRLGHERGGLPKLPVKDVQDEGEPVEQVLAEARTPRGGVRA